MRLLVLGVLLVACDAGAPPPPVHKPAVRDDASIGDASLDAASPVDAALGRRHSIPRTKLAIPGVDATKLPVHGIALFMWYLGGDSQTVIDFDGAMLHHHENSMMVRDKPVDRHTKVAAAHIARLRTLGFAAWDEEPTGPMPQATDIRQDLVVLDGDDAFYLSGYPISISIGEGTGRPAASGAVNGILERLERH